MHFAESQLQGGHRNAAEHSFKRALRTDSRNIAAHLQLAQLYSFAGREFAACEHLRSALRYDPGNVETAVAYADCKRQVADFGNCRHEDLMAAARGYCYARSLNMKDAETAIKLADCYSQLGEHLLAVQTCREAIELDPKCSDARLVLGEIYERGAYFESALREYKQALQLDHTNVVAHNGAARANLQLSRCDATKAAISLERAAAHFKQSLEIEPNQPDVREAIRNLEASATKSPDALAD